MAPLMGQKNLAVKLQSMYTNAIIRVQLNPALQTLHYQLSVIDLSFLSVENLLVDCIMMFPEKQSAR